VSDVPAPDPEERPRKSQGQFRSYDLGFVRIDIKHSPKLRTPDGECRSRLSVLRHRPALAARALADKCRRDDPRELPPAIEADLLLQAP
jgi:hypothetical protein